MSKLYLQWMLSVQITGSPKIHRKHASVSASWNEVLNATETDDLTSSDRCEEYRLRAQV